MKRMLTIATVLMLMACMVSAGPLNKGAMKLGGTVGFDSFGGDLGKAETGETQTTIMLSPEFGYFFSDGFCAGLTINMAKWSSGDYKTTDFAFGPMVAYFFGAANMTEAKGTAIPYLSAHFLIANDKFENPGEEDIKYKGTTFGARLGMDYFMTNSVALDFGVDFNSDSRKFEQGSYESESVSGTHFGFSAGISAFVM